MNPAPATRPDPAGYGYGIAAYAAWGVIPIFWKYLSHVPVTELIGHRVIWAFVTFAALLWLRGRAGEITPALRHRRTLAAIALSGALLAANWLTFVHAVSTDRVLHVSLGYFINPLVSVLLGMVVLGERLRTAQWLALALAAAGVLQFAVQADGLPWISLVLAGTFGFYGLVRKTVQVDALPGSTIETCLLLPAALGYLALLHAQGQGHMFRGDAATHLLLLATGLITALPLLWFTNAARRLPLAAVGFLQYLAPSLQFVLAVALFDEVFTPVHLRGFLCIWAGLALFSFDSWQRLRATGYAHTRA